MSYIIDLSEDAEDNVLECPAVKSAPKIPTSSPPKSRLNAFSCSQTYSFLKRYKNGAHSSIFPKIVNVRSLAGPSQSPMKVHKVHCTYPGKRKEGLLRKQSHPVSSTQSIEDSINRCIEKHCSPTVVDLASSEEVEASVSNENTSHDSRNIPSCDKKDEQIDGEMMSNNKTGNQCTKKQVPVNLGVTETTLLFREFIYACARLEENSEDRERVQAKLRNYHEKTGAFYRDSKEFGELLQQQLNIIDKSNIYVCIKEVLDELKSHKIRRISLLPSSSSTSNAFVEERVVAADLPGTSDVSGVPLSAKDERIVNKLTETLVKLNRKIKMLEETEVDFDEEEDSTYLRLERYKERSAKIYRKLCQYTSSPLHAGRVTKKKIKFNHTKFHNANLLIEQWLNRTGKFPDFLDIVKLFESLNLGLKSENLRIIATEAFREIGNILQKRRRIDLWDSLGMFSIDDGDPATSDPNLQQKLETNREVYKKKEQELIDLFVEKQMMGPPEEVESNHDDEKTDDEISNNGLESDNSAENETKNSYKKCKSSKRRLDENTLSSLPISDESLHSSTDSPKGPPSEASNSRDIVFVDLHERTIAEEKNIENELVVATSMNGTVKGDLNVSSKKRKRGWKFHEDINDSSNKKDTEKENRRIICAKPFGSVGEIVEINFFRYLNLMPKDMFSKNMLKDSNILKNQVNTIHGKNRYRLRKRKNNPEIAKEIQETIAKYFRNEEISTNDFSFLLSKAVLKNHGVITNDSARSENLSTSQNEKPSAGSDRSAEGNPEGSGRTGGNGNGNGDEEREGDKNRRRTDGERPNYEEETEDGEDSEQENKEAEHARNSKDAASAGTGLNETNGIRTIDDSAENEGKIVEHCGQEDINQNESNNGELKETKGNGDKMNEGNESNGENKGVVECQEQALGDGEALDEEDYCNETIQDATMEEGETGEATAEEFGENGSNGETNKEEEDIDNNEIRDSYADENALNNIQLEDTNFQEDIENNKTGEVIENNRPAEDSACINENPEETENSESGETTEHAKSTAGAEPTTKEEGSNDGERKRNEEEDDWSNETDDEKISEANEDEKVEVACELSTENDKELGDDQQKNDETNSLQDKKERELAVNSPQENEPSEERKRPKREAKTKSIQNYAWIDHSDSEESKGADEKEEKRNKGNESKNKTHHRAWIRTDSESSPSPEPEKVNLKKSEKPQEKPKEPVKRKPIVPSSSDEPAKPKIRRLPPKPSNAGDIEVISENIVRKPDLFADDRVKRFLASASTSLSITITKKKPMSLETKNALERLKHMKNISATRVAKTTPEIMVIDEKPGPSCKPPSVARSHVVPTTPTVTIRNPVRPAIRRGTPIPVPRGRPPNNSAMMPRIRTPQLSFVRRNSPRPVRLPLNGLPFISNVRGTPPGPIITNVTGRSTRMPLTPSRGRGRGRGAPPTRGRPKTVQCVVLD